jgi:hypothetical protein
MALFISRSYCIGGFVTLTRDFPFGFMLGGVVFCDFLPGQRLCKPVPACEAGFLSRSTVRKLSALPMRLASGLRTAPTRGPLPPGSPIAAAPATPFFGTIPREIFAFS